ncbi:DUF6221 family protein [Microbispora sp. NPDC088329]|uniref:DUF6221 family protein n=1 Tax=Microbispora sp. NPDC088329 TaxID=3154869 RepID=UPI003426D4B1
MSDELIDWLRAQIEARKVVAEAAAREGDNPVWQDGGEYVYADRDTYPGGTTYIAVGPWDGPVPDAVRAHLVLNDPRDVIARCRAELAELDMIDAIPHQRVEDDDWWSCAQARDERGELACGNDCRAGGPCDCGRDPLVSRLLRAKAYGYSHRPGWREEWRP